MRGHILISKRDGRRSIYVPEAHIQLYISKVRDQWTLAAFRTDGYYGLRREDLIPTIEHLRQAYQWTAELDVPEHVVAFAVESERRRQESVEGIEEILTSAVRGGSREDGFKELMAQLGREKLDAEFSQEAEHAIGKEIEHLLNQKGGLQ